MIDPIIVSSAISKPLTAYNMARCSTGCHLTVRNLSSHPLKPGLCVTSSNALLTNYKEAQSFDSDYLMPNTQIEFVVQSNGWRSNESKFKIFLSYHVADSEMDIQRMTSTWFCQFHLPVSVVYDRNVSYFCGFSNAFPNVDFKNESNSEMIFQCWKDQMLQLSRYALQVQNDHRVLECYAGDSKFAEIKIDFICRCDKCLSHSKIIRKTGGAILSYPLHEAVLDANAVNISRLLKIDSADTIDFRGRTPLHLAAKENFFDIGRLLLENGADKEARDFELATPLIEAAFWGSFDVIKLLTNELAKTGQCNLRAARQDGRTALHEAARLNHAEIVKYFLTKDSTLVNTADAKGYTPLHLAAEMGSFESAKILLDHYADLKLLTSFGATALHLACRGAHTDILDLLMHKCRAQQYLRVEDAFGFTPMRYAIFAECIPFIKTLANYGGDIRYISAMDKRMAVHDVAEIGNENVLKFLIKDYKLGVNETDLYGNTPMHIAAYFGRIVIVRDLVSEYRASTSIVNASGATAFFLACQQGETSVVKYLIDIDPYLMRIPIVDDSRLPIHYAIYNGHEHIVEAMIENGIDILSCNDARRKTVFDFAVQAGRSKIAEMLIKALKKNQLW